MAAELARHGIRVNAIAAGLIETEMSAAHILRDPGLRESYARLIPSGRPGRPEEIAQAAVFLASAEASYVTGHVLTVDGGWSGVMYDPGFEER
jgi:NAD(P)-dependent dehydrogenase (short-subunit alcohol dehydrogenase family)